MSQSSEHPTMVFEYFVREAESVGHRADWFLLFHAILLDAFLAADEPHLAIAWFGVLTGYLWLVTGIRQTWDMQHLSDCLGEPGLMGAQTAHVFEALFRVRRTAQPIWMRWARATPTLCIVIPAALVLVWLALLWPLAKPGAVLGALACCVLATVLIVVLRVFPQVPRSAVKAMAPPESSSPS